LPLLKAAYDKGLNVSISKLNQTVSRILIPSGLQTWDTANVYSNGESEIIIGKAIKKFNIPRHKLVILTKCHGTVGEQHNVRPFYYQKDVAKSKDYVNQGGV
jgi:aryl-alcohol dehydrogenase-like predicted oxidoreductase